MYSNPLNVIYLKVFNRSYRRVTQIIFDAIRNVLKTVVIFKFLSHFFRKNQKLILIFLCSISVHGNCLKFSVSL